MNAAKIGFKPEKITVPLEWLLPVRQIQAPQKRVARYRTILESLKVGRMVEPLVVYPQTQAADKSVRYLILDGHLRFYALKEIGVAEVDCIISTDDESYTYNAKVTKLAPIQEHAMIVKAIQNGVDPERIAASLNLTLEKILSIINLLDGIHPEAVDLLKDKQITPDAIRILKKVTTIRQIEMAELMVSTSNFTQGYAQALFMGTPKDQLMNPEKPKKVPGMSAEDIARIEHEMENLESDFKAVEESFGETVLNLTLGRGYVKRLLDNAKIARYLGANYPDIFSEFEAVAAAEAL